MKLSPVTIKKLEGVAPQLIPLMLEKARAGEWSVFFGIVDNPFRMDALLAVNAALSDSEFWQSFQSIWMQAENLWEDHATLKKLLALKRDGKTSTMVDTEREALCSLPDTISVFRGAGARNSAGYSWTLSKDRAEWFAANRLAESEAFCFSGRCSKMDVIALLLERQEQEIIIDPNKVRVLNIDPVKVVQNRNSYYFTKASSRARL